MKNSKQKVAWCSICQQGWVEIYKDKYTKTLFVCCDECESRWEHPSEISYVNIATSIFDTDIEIEEPTEGDIRLKDWEKYILN